MPTLEERSARGGRALTAIVRTVRRMTEPASWKRAVTEVGRRAIGSFGKRVVDPVIFRPATDEHRASRTALLERAGLTRLLKTRNRLHMRRAIRDRGEEVVNYPDSLQVAVTTQCNIRCRMCALTAHGKHYVGSHADPMIFERIEPILPFVSTIKLQGTGEPFLYPGMRQACELAAKHQVSLTTVTNATVIDDEMARLVGPTFSEIVVSIDAATPETYKIIRSGARFEQVMRGIELINKYRNPQLQLWFAFTIMRYNAHELPELVRLAKRVGVQAIQASWLIPVDGLPWSFDQEPSTDPELMARSFAEARSVAADLGVTIKLPPPLAPSPKPTVTSLAKPSARAAKKDAPAAPPPPPTGVIANLRGSRVEGVCSLMYSNAYIHVGGGVTPCCFLRGEVGTLRDADFRSIWNGEKMVKLRKTFNDGTLPSSCTGCAFLRMGRVGTARLIEA